MQFFTRTRRCSGYSLTAVMRAAGIEPGAVLGYSLGEYIGLTVAGCLSWEDGLRLVMRQAQIFANARFRFALASADVLG